MCGLHCTCVDCRMLHNNIIDFDIEPSFGLNEYLEDLLNPNLLLIKIKLKLLYNGQKDGF